MKLTFHGAAGEVTGSCTLIETSRARVLVDFGMHQGGVESEIRNRRTTLQPLIQAGHPDAVVLTHAHIDHCGRMPMLAAWGYKGPIYTTPASADLTEILLRDSADIQESDALRMTRARQRAGREPAPPLYAVADVEKLLPLFRTIPYEQWTDIAPGVRLRFFDAGHILGSASAELRITENGQEKVIVFSGDLGPKGVPLLRDPTPPPPADVLILESTYGDRDHRPLRETVAEFEKIISESVWAKEKVIIPSFAVGRTQQLTYYLGELARSGRLPHFPVYVDSPLALSATDLYRRHPELFDTEARALLQQGECIFDCPNLRFTRSAQESKQLNDMWGMAVIIAASGMCTGGRILHHLKHHLWRKGTHVVMVGYQAAGSLGRRLVEKAPRVRIMGEWIAVRAEIHTLGGFSAHAGRGELLDWASNVKSKPRVFLNHGEDRARTALAQGLRERFGWESTLPEYQSVHEI